MVTTEEPQLMAAANESTAERSLKQKQNKLQISTLGTLLVKVCGL